MNPNFALSAAQRDKVTALQKAFRDCEDAGIGFFFDHNRLLKAFTNPGVKVARPYLGDCCPGKDVTDDVRRVSLTVTQGITDMSEPMDMFYMD